MATREEVLAATTIACKSEIVEDARRGGDGKVLIVELDSKAAVLLDESNFQTVGTQRKVIRDGLYNARWIVATARTLDGKPMFTADDIPAVGLFPTTLSEKLLEVAQRVNSIGVKPLADAVKN